MVESCAGVERELRNVLDKLQKFSDNSSQELDKTATALREILADEGEWDKGLLLLVAQAPTTSSFFAEFLASLATDSPTPTLMLIKTLHFVKESVSKVGSDHRELHSSVSKVGKAIDRHFVTDYDSTS